MVPGLLAGSTDHSSAVGHVLRNILVLRNYARTAMTKDEVISEHTTDLQMIRNRFLSVKRHSAIRTLDRSLDGKLCH